MSVPTPEVKKPLIPIPAIRRFTGNNPLFRSIFGANRGRAGLSTSPGLTARNPALTQKAKLLGN